MRVAQFVPSLLLSIGFALGACGGSAPPPAAPSDGPAPASPSASDAPSANDAPVHEDETWSGEKASQGASAPSSEPGAEPAPADGKAPETRTMDVIRKLVMDNRKAARQCYEDARKEQKDLRGDLVIHFVLDPEGKVKSAELNEERSTLKSKAVAECVIAVIRGIHFPRSSRAMETSTNYPFNFTP